MGSFAFDILIDVDTYNYNYFSKTVSFQLSQTCLESNPLAAHSDFVEAMQDFISSNNLGGGDEDESSRRRRLQDQQTTNTTGEGA